MLLQSGWIHHHLVDLLHVYAHHLEPHQSQVTNPHGLTSNQMFPRSVVVLWSMNQNCNVVAIVGSQTKPEG